MGPGGCVRSELLHAPPGERRKPLKTFEKSLIFSPGPLRCTRAITQEAARFSDRIPTSDAFVRDGMARWPRSCESRGRRAQSRPSRTSVAVNELIGISTRTTHREIPPPCDSSAMRGCVARDESVVPMRVVSARGGTALVEDPFGDVTEVSVDFVSPPRRGDVVLVHLGMALSVIPARPRPRRPPVTERRHLSLVPPRTNAADASGRRGSSRSRR